MDELDLSFSVTFRHHILFTEDALAPSNPCLARLMGGAKVLCVVDAGLVAANPALVTGLLARGLNLTRPPLVLPGGEACKHDPAAIEALTTAIAEVGSCRHSFVLAIGGGAFLDLVGYVAATAHRGVRLVRMPTTTLGQADAGVGVKNAVNAQGRKNFTGTFAPPFAVVNDLSLLTTLPLRLRREGLVEAVKVALLKDAAFLAALEQDASALARGDLPAIGRAVRRSAELHARHIAEGGDPFELGSARPLDLGHWAAHRLEVLSAHRLSHGEAVAIGLALDVLVARDLGHLAAPEAERVLALLRTLGFELWDELLGAEDSVPLLAGLDEFREHLGGELTLVLPLAPGRSTQIHALPAARVRAAVADLRARAHAPCAARS
jgi:3-dehydroquinate synthase